MTDEHDRPRSDEPATGRDDEDRVGSDETTHGGATRLSDPKEPDDATDRDDTAARGGARPWPDWIGVVPIALLALLHERAVSARVQDDAFITFRYAKNLVDGRGLVMNAGERVEGVTSLLFTLLSALAQALTIDPLVFARALSSVSTVALLFAMFALVRRLAPTSAVLAYAPPTLLAGSWAFAVNAMTGLETALFSALLFGGTVALLFERRALASTLLALGLLTRPEAAGLFLVLTPIALVPVRRDPRAIARWLAPFLLVLLVESLFRRAYYGAWVPNTYVAKAGTSLPPALGTPATYVERFFRKEGDWSFVLVGLSTLGLVPLRRRPAQALLLSAVAFGVVTVLRHGADFMLGGRFLVPYLPFLYVAAALGLDGALTRTRLALDARGAVALAGALAFAFAGYRRSTDLVRPFEELRRRVTDDAVRGAEAALRPRLQPGAKVATLDIGELGFRNLDWSFVDISGLTDRELARAPGDLFDREFDVDAFFARGIEAVVFVSQAARPTTQAAKSPYWPPGSSARLRAARAFGDFEYAGSFPSYEALVREGDALRAAAPGEHGRAASYHLEVWVKRR